MSTFVCLLGLGLQYPCLYEIFQKIVQSSQMQSPPSPHGRSHHWVVKKIIHFHSLILHSIQVVHFIYLKKSLIDQQQQFFSVFYMNKFYNFSLCSETMRSYVCLEGFRLEYAGNYTNNPTKINQGPYSQNLIFFVT